MVNAEQKLQSDIEAACPGIPVRAFSAADSTDAQALRALSAGETGPVIFSALEQTGDRAAGDSFSSHEGISAHFSLLLGPGGERVSPLSITSMAAAACVMAIERLTPQRPVINWPGEICIGGKQIAAILVNTAVAQGHCGIIVGITVNICGGEPQNEPFCAFGSLEAPYLSPGRLAGEIARELLGLVNDPGNRAYMEFYRDRSTALEKEITYIVAGEERTARVMGVDDDGALIILNRNGTPERFDDTALAFRFG